MITSTTDMIPNRKIAEVLGLVSGNVLYKHSAFTHTSISLSYLFKAKLQPVGPELMANRRIAIANMITESKSLSADAIIGVRFETSDISDGYIELFCFGTAVKLSSDLD